MHINLSICVIQCVYVYIDIDIDIFFLFNLKTRNAALDTAVRTNWYWDCRRD